MSRTKRHGRGWAYACAQLGGVASVAANVAHSWVPPATAGPGWQPPPGAVIASVFWPVALLATIEAFARVAWPRGWRYGFLRFCGLLPVALVAAVVSYLHMSGLLASYGAGWFEVHVGPLAVDGLMVIGTSALIATSPSKLPGGREARQDAGLPPTAPGPEWVNPSPPEADQPAETATQSGNGHKPDAARRIAAVADLAAGTDPVAVAAQAGVTVGTVQRWADDAAKAARRPRGGRRNHAQPDNREQ